MTVSPINRKIRNIFFDPKTRFSLLSGQPIFVWTMGKVGSTAIIEALEPVKGKTVFTSHFMNDNDHYRSRVLYKYLIKPQIPLKIISLVRDPIGKNVSSFFQNFKKNTGMSHIDIEYDVDRLSNLFFNRYKKHHSPLTWFDENIKNFTGIDIYSTPFPKERKYCQYNSGKYDLLVMRCDLSNERKATAIENFLNLSPGAINISSRNVGSNKQYSAMYKRFKSDVVFSQKYLDEMTESKYYNYFYTTEEINSLNSIWKHHLGE